MGQLKLLSMNPKHVLFLLFWSTIANTLGLYDLCIQKSTKIPTFMLNVFPSGTRKQHVPRLDLIMLAMNGIENAYPNTSFIHSEDDVIISVAHNGKGA